MQESLTEDIVVSTKKQELLELLKQKEAWVKKHRIYYYSPLPAQAQFHKSKAHVRLVEGTNRSGKTTSGVCEDISRLLGFRPWELPKELKQFSIEHLLKNPQLIPEECKTQQKTPIKLLLVVEDWETADGIFVSGEGDRAGKITYYLPEMAIRSTEKNAMGYICQWNTINGSTLKIETEKSYINNPKSVEGFDWDFIHYDEPKMRNMRVALKRGLVDRNGFELFTLTPLTEPWIFDELHMKAVPGTEIENFFLHANDNPYISKAGWASFVESLTEDEKEARAEGRWMHLRGLVYKEFSARASKDGGHICEPLSAEWVYDNCSLYLAIDPHPRQPMAAMILAVDDKGRMFVWEELFVKTLIEDFCTLIRSKLIFKTESEGKEKVIELKPVYEMIDPLAFEEDPVDGNCWAMEFWENGFNVEKAPKRKEQGIMDVRHAFKENKLFICSNCVRTIYEIQHYVYQEWQSGQRNEKEKPIDKDDHMMENLYRLVLVNPKRVIRGVGKAINAKDLC